MSDTIISAQAWACGDKSCAAQWHQRNFWAYSDGTYSVDEHSDGDHEDCDESDLPSHQEVDASWRDYAAHVAATGLDPLGNYYVSRSVGRREVWHFAFNKSIVGPVLLRAKRGRRVIPGHELPKHVRDYLGLDALARCLTGLSWQELGDAMPGLKAGRWTRHEIEHHAPRKPETIARELRAAARRHLSRKGQA
jgi:hypothetical protein